MSDVDAQIRVSIDTQQAQAQLTALQQQITLLQKSMAANAGQNLNLGAGVAGKQLGDLNGKIINVKSSLAGLDKALAGTSRSFQDSMRTMVGAFKKTGPEMDLIRERAKVISAEYKKIGDGAKGMSSVLVTEGTVANRAAAESAMRMQMFTRALDQAGTAALNWGKNMQWAGRQLMVGFTVPLTIFATIATKAFQDIEREIVNLQRVYGDFTTSSSETDRMTQSIKELSVEMSNLGFTAKETIAIAADAAATGAVGQDLIDMTKNATQLAALGMITQEQALDTIISMNSAFGVAADELGGVVDYLNAVENQTVLSLGDMTQAIPLVAPVVKGLGGDVKELAVVMTAMREGGIGANEAANALKTGLARLITPTRQAKETALKFGINLQQIVAENEGDFLGMIDAMSRGLSDLSDLQQQQVLSDVFGKRQFARFGALFENFNKEGSQAARTMDLLGASAEDLARQTDKELGALEESESMKLAKAMEELKMAIAPIGRMVMQFLTPLIEFGSKIFAIFDGMGEGFKKVVGGIAVAVGLVIPGLLMVVGLFANLAGNAMNAGKALLNILFGFKGAAKGAETLTLEELEQAAAAQALASAQMQVTNSLELQERAVYDLVNAYNRLNAAQASGGGTMRPPMRFATGGRVPGAGNTDKVPALLTPGEFVINKKQSQKNSGFLHALNSGSVQGFSVGGDVAGRGGVTLGSIQKARGGDYTHGDAGKTLVFSTDKGVEAETKRLHEVLEARKAIIKATKDQIEADRQSGKISEESARRKIAALEAEEEAIEGVKTDWENLTDAQKKSGGVATMSLHSNQVALIDSDVNKAMNSQGAGALPADIATDLRNRPDAYDYMVNRSIHDDAVEDDLSTVAARAGAGEDLTRRMADKADRMGPDHVIVDKIDASAAVDPSKTQVEYSTLQNESLDELISETEEQVRAEEGNTDITEEAKQENIKRLAALKRLREQLETEGDKIAQARTSMHETVEGKDAADFATEEQMRDRSKRKSGRSLKFKTGELAQRQAQEGKKQKEVLSHRMDKVRKEGVAGGVARTRMKGSYTSAGEQIDLEGIRQRIRQDGIEIGVELNQGIAQGIQQSSETPEQAIRQTVGDTIDAANQEAEINSPSRATERVGKAMDDGLAQGVRNNARVPVAAAGEVGEQMELEFDESFDGERQGRDSMDEVERGAKGNQPDMTTTGGKGSQKMEFMRNKMGMGGMIGGQVLSMASMMAMQAEGEKVAGVSKELVASFGAVAGQVNSFAGMLPPMAQGIVAAGTLIAAGVGYAVAKWREGVDEASREAADLGASLGGAAQAAERMARMFNQSTLIERRRQLKLSEEEKERYQQFSPMFESEEGKKIVEELGEITGPERFAEIESYVQNAVVQGFVEGADAELFARAFAEQLGDVDLGNALAKSIGEFNETFETTTDKAVEIAEKRMREANKFGDLSDAREKMQQGNALSYKEASLVVGTSMQGLRDWTTVLEAAKEDYRKGTISFQELKKATDKVTDAQEKLSAALSYAIKFNTDRGGVEQALQDQLEKQGYGEEVAGDVSGRVENQIRENLGYGNTGFFGSSGGFASGGKASAEEVRKEAIEVNKAVAQALGDVAIAVSTGMPVEEAERMAADIADETTLVAKAYKEAIAAGADQFRAMQAAIAAKNLEMDPSNPLAPQNDGSDPNKDLREKYVRLTSGSFDPTSLGNITKGMDIEGFATVINAIADLKFVDVAGLNPMEANRITGEATEQSTDLELLLNANTDILGPELTELLTPYVADGIEDGMEEGGLKGLGQLSDILGGDREALEAYIRVVLADDSLGEDDIQLIVDNLVYANSRIPKELQVSIGLDLKDPKGKDMDPEEWKKLIDDTAIMANMVKGIDSEEEKMLAIQFAFQDGVRKKNMTPAKFRKEFQNVMDLVDEMDGADFEAKKKLMVDIITALNGEEADPAAVETAIDKMQSKFGKAGVVNIPPTVFAKIVDMDVNAQGLRDSAQGMLNSITPAMMATPQGQAFYDEAKGMLEAANQMDKDAMDLGAEYVWGGGGSDSGGGGGGGGDKEFDEGIKGDYKPKSRWDKYRKRESSNQAGIIGYTEAIRRTTNLTENQIEELKENDKAYKKWKEAYKDFLKTGDDKELQKFERKYMKGEYSDAGKSIGDQNAANTRKTVTENRKAEQAQKKMNQRGVGYFEQQQLLNDPELMAQFMSDNKKLSNDALNQARERAMAETTVLDIYERQMEVRAQQLDYEQQQMEYAIMKAEYAAEDNFFAGVGTDRATLDQRNAEIDARQNTIQATQIKPLQHLIKLEQDKIKIKQRGMKIYEDEIKKLNKEVKIRQRTLEDMKRALELRQREGEMLDHDLQLMGYQEEDINEMYDKRVEALEKVLSINQAIAAQQKSQLDLASALTSGDIGAAARAAQQMQEQQAQQAADAYRAQMETNKESAINSLTGAESGMTREQIEMRKRELEEDSYQTNLKIRALDDEIYNLNRKIRDENDQIDIIKEQIEVHNSKIKDYEWDIFQIEVNQLRTLEDQKIKNDALLAQADQAVTFAAAEEKIQLKRFERGRKLEEATQALQLAGLKILEEQGKLHSVNFDMLKASAKAAKEYWNALNKGTLNEKNLVKPELVGANFSKIVAQQDIGKALFEGIDMSELDVTKMLGEPKYKIASATQAVPNGAVNGIMGNITNHNNYMNNSVNVNAAAANAQEVADIVYRRLEIDRLKNTGG